ncbi:MAG: pentapeptide repeat-containing protein, partial [Thermoanaerobaculia bacterium]|nr:pentapeptide repeat-containing protein [Thermoanaerobaculia bacterium]
MCSDQTIMEEKDNWIELEAENRQLRERLENLEKELTMRRYRSRLGVLRFLVQTYATKPLYGSVSKLVDQLADRKVERDTVKDVLYATLRRLTRVGFLTMTIALAPLVMALLQTYYLKKQNEKLDIQNKRIEQQTYLQEAERRSSLVFLFDNIMNKIDEELRSNPEQRDLSPQLIGRIVALTKALKPYRYLEGDTITSRMTSPERGQVLLSLIASRLSHNTSDQIFLLADFSYATLQHVNLDGAYLRNINLSNAILESVSLTGADLSHANFEGSEITDAHVQWAGMRAKAAFFDFANFYNARITDSDFGGCSFEFANFSETHLYKVAFRRAFFNQAKFEQVSASDLDFGEALLMKTVFSLAESKRGTPKPDIKFDDIQTDTVSFNQISRLPLARGPELDSSQREFRIKEDSFYIDGRRR